MKDFLPGIEPPGQVAPPLSLIPDHEIVRFSQPEWERRAFAAREAQEKLEHALDLMQGVAQRNCYGECAEGREFFARARHFAQGFRSSLETQIKQVAELARQCEEAGRRLEEQDLRNARDIPT